MKDELSYIDNITRDKLKGYTVSPNTSWELMNSKLTNVVTGSTFGGFFYKISDFFTRKFFVASVVILSVLIVGILMSKDESENEIFQKDSSENNKEYYHEFDFNTASDAKKSTYAVDDSLTNNNEAGNNENNSKDIIIKIEVPVHKNVLIKREIIINDTINNKDNVKIE